MKRDYTMFEGQTSWHTKTEYQDIMQSSDEQGKGDIIDVPATKNNIIDAIGHILSIEYDINPLVLSEVELTRWGQKLEYIF